MFYEGFYGKSSPFMNYCLQDKRIVDKIRISGFPNEAEDCEALVIEGQIPRAREASKIRDILDNTAQNIKHGKLSLGIMFGGRDSIAGISPSK
ncbi:hypothetical protein Tco_1142743 [Tanacetum coccineum]